MNNLKRMGVLLAGFVLLVLLCFIPKEEVKAETAASPSVNAIRNQYCDMLDMHKGNIKDSNKLNDSEKSKVDEIIDRTKKTIRNLSEEPLISKAYSEAVTQIDKIAADARARHDKETANEEKDKLPSSTNDYIIPGNYWETPVAEFGQEVIVCLPIVNMFKYDVTNVVVTPVLTNDHKTSPFEIGIANYALQFERLQGSDANSNIINRTKNLFWTFKTREDVLNGYYKVDYKVLYTNIDNKQETATISTYVKAVGKPDAGNVDGSKEEEDKNKSTPRIIVTGFETTPEEVFAGSTFTLNLKVKNTSQKTAVSNLEMNLEAAVEGKDNDTTYSAFLPESGSNTLYIDSIAPGATKDLSIALTAKADLVQKPYALKIHMKYEDAKFNAFENTSSVSIPVRQQSKFDVSSIEAMPNEIAVGSESNVMFSIYNTGKTKLYNVQVKFKGNTVKGGDTFVGNLDSGATGNVDAMLTGTAPSTDEGLVTATISYEDDTGKLFSMEKEFTVNVTEAVQEMLPSDGMMDMEMEQPKVFPMWGIAAICGGMIAVIVVVVIIVKKKKKKALSLLADDDDEE